MLGPRTQAECLAGPDHTQLWDLLAKRDATSFHTSIAARALLQTSGSAPQTAVLSKCIKRKKTQAEGYRHAGKQHRNPSQNTPVAECSLHPSDHIYRSNSANQWMETQGLCNRKPEGLTQTPPKLMDMFTLIQWIHPA